MQKKKYSQRFIPKSTLKAINLVTHFHIVSLQSVSVWHIICLKDCGNFYNTLNVCIYTYKITIYLHIIHSIDIYLQNNLST